MNPDIAQGNLFWSLTTTFSLNWLYPLSLHNLRKEAFNGWPKKEASSGCLSKEASSAWQLFFCLTRMQAMFKLGLEEPVKQECNLAVTL